MPHDFFRRRYRTATSVTPRQLLFVPCNQSFANPRPPLRVSPMPHPRIGWPNPLHTKTMATERQIQANRANAKRSTGPVTEKGKQASWQNALRHSQLSSCVVLTAESTPFFNQLMDSLIEEFQPRTANETALIETMAVARWKLMRNWTIHTGLLEIEMAKQDQEAGNPPVLAALAFKSLADSSCSLHLLQRYETSLDRQYSRALNNLLKSRAAAKSQDLSTPSQPEPAAAQPGPHSRSRTRREISKGTQFASQPLTRRRPKSSSPHLETGSGDLHHQPHPSTPGRQSTTKRRPSRRNPVKSDPAQNKLLARPI